MYATDACANIEMMTASYARLACAQCIKQKNSKKSEKGKRIVNFLLYVYPPTVQGYFLLQAWTLD